MPACVPYSQGAVIPAFSSQAYFSAAMTDPGYNRWTAARAWLTNARAFQWKQRKSILLFSAF
jgi:hypothetical protein